MAMKHEDEWSSTQHVIPVHDSCTRHACAHVPHACSNVIQSTPMPSKGFNKSEFLDYRIFFNASFSYIYTVYSKTYIFINRIYCSQASKIVIVHDYK